MKGNFVGFNIDIVRAIAYQTLSAMRFLHEEVKIIHTDLKPENILFASSEYTTMNDISKAPVNIAKKASPKEKFSYRAPLNYSVKIIDFGGAIYFEEAHDGLINTRQYRSPEVILGSKNWNEKTDVWSLACILCELYTGELLFQTHSDKEHLALIWSNSSKSLFIIFRGSRISGIDDRIIQI